MRLVLPLAGAAVLGACQPAGEPPAVETARADAAERRPSSTFHQALAAMELTPETAKAVAWEEFRQDRDQAVFIGVEGREDGERWTADRLAIVNPRLEDGEPIFDRWEIKGYRTESGGASFETMSLTGPNSAYAESLVSVLTD